MAFSAPSPRRGWLGAPDHSTITEYRNTAYGAGGLGNHRLQDHQFQLMLLEQQNKRRLLMARREQDSSSIPNLWPPPIPTGVDPVAWQHVTSPIQQAYLNENLRTVEVTGNSLVVQPSPSYYSAASSPWTNALMHPSPGFLHPSPLYYSAHSSPAFARQ
jgi:hypothetical protein